MIYDYAFVKKPNLFHGHDKTGAFFEGWYFRFSLPSGRSIAFIPGIAMGPGAHSFVQVVDSKRREGLYFPYPQEAFSSCGEQLSVRVGDNRFSLSQVTLGLKSGTASIEGTLRLHNIAKWPDSALAPGSMGVFNHLPFLECYSQVTALDGRASGKLLIDGKPVPFGGASLYIEKNWGSSFPSCWFWAQSNRFLDGRAAFTCSIGRVPIGGFSFDGLLACLLLDGHYHRFTTMNGSVFRIVKRRDGCVLKLGNHRHVLTAKIADHPPFLRLPAPKTGEMSGRAPESLTSRIELSLQEIRTGELLYEGVSEQLGLEYGGGWEKRSHLGNRGPLPI